MTHNLKQWMSQNVLFKYETLMLGSTVRCNAFEASYAIPQLVNRSKGTSFNDFVFTSSVREIIQDPRTKYFVWGTQWGDQDLRILEGMWSPAFLSDHWIVFRHMTN